MSRDFKVKINRVFVYEQKNISFSHLMLKSDVTLSAGIFFSKKGTTSLSPKSHSSQVILKNSDS